MRYVSNVPTGHWLSKSCITAAANSAAVNAGLRGLEGARPQDLLAPQEVLMAAMSIAASSLAQKAKRSSGYWKTGGRKGRTDGQKTRLSSTCS
jgi:hypothetical protein